MRFPILGRETRKDGDREAMSKKGMRVSRITMNPMVLSLKGPNKFFISKNTKHQAWQFESQPWVEYFEE